MREGWYVFFSCNYNAWTNKSLFLDIQLDTRNNYLISHLIYLFRFSWKDRSFNVYFHFELGSCALCLYGRSVHLCVKHFCHDSVSVFATARIPSRVSFVGNIEIFVHPLGGAIY